MNKIAHMSPVDLQEMGLYKIAEGYQLLRQAKNSLLNPTTSKAHAIQGAAVGGLGGVALTGLLTALAGERDRKTGKKSYLRNMLLGLVGGATAGGVYGYKRRPDFNAQLKNLLAYIRSSAPTNGADTPPPSHPGILANSVK